MDTVTTSAKKLPLTAVLIGLFSVALLASGLYYLNHPAPAAAPQENDASRDAKSYLPNLQLSDVAIQATENFMHQQVVEIQGNITNKGPRKLGVVDVYCLFSGIDGKQIYRERLTIAHDLPPHQTRSFRLPFDTLPDGWNQAMPHMIIARISFGS